MTSFMEDKEDGACCAAEKPKIGNLTDDWKAEKLKGWYFILDIHGKITPDFIYEDTTLKNFARKEVKEVLSPCDYDELQRLKECANGNKLALAINKIQAKEIEQLRQLLKDCKDKIEPIMGDIPTFKKLILRINEVLK